MEWERRRFGVVEVATAVEEERVELADVMKGRSRRFIVVEETEEETVRPLGTRGDGSSLSAYGRGIWRK